MAIRDEVIDGVPTILVKRNGEIIKASEVEELNNLTSVKFNETLSILWIERNSGTLSWQVFELEKFPSPL